MKTLLRRSRTEAPAGLVGVVRLDRDARVLAGRLHRGDIAVIDHVDLDRQTAGLLVSKGVAAVLNAGPTVSGRYPSLGATVLSDAGVEIVDSVGPEAFSLLRDGEKVRLFGDTVLRGDQPVLTGHRQDAASVASATSAAEAGLATQMEAFAATAAEYLRREHALLLEPGLLPEVPALRDRDVVVVAPGAEHREDLLRLRRFAREYHPVVVAVDEAADTALELGYTPTVVVGDLSEVSDRALRAAKHIVVRLDRDVTTAGLARVDRMGLPRDTVTTTARPAELALLLADENDPRVVVAAGMDRTLVTMLDSGRSDAAAAFLTRLRVGSRLVDADAVARLHRPRVSGWLLVLLLVVALAALVAAAWLTPVGQDTADTVTDRLSEIADSLRGTPAGETTP